tara:strand:- start:145 stop:558 length:414 start_codon:yes stop_codon:yes gene_type:complete
MKMKKVLMILAVVLAPVLLMAQAKKVSTNRAIGNSNQTAYVSYEYMTMKATKAEKKTVQSPKKGKKTTEKVQSSSERSKMSISFDFGVSARVREADLLNRKASSLNTLVDALNFLGSNGWELVSVSGDTYLLKRKSR